MNATVAYLDPGSAGMVLQMIAGGLAALAVSIKLFWRRRKANEVLAYASKQDGAIGGQGWSQASLFKPGENK